MSDDKFLELNDKIKHAVNQLGKPDCARITVFFQDLTDQEVLEACKPFVNHYWVVARIVQETPVVWALSWSETDLYKFGINPYFTYNKHTDESK